MLTHALFVLLLNAELVVPIPSVEGWTVVSTSELDVRADNYKTEFLGLVVNYSNPHDPNEVVRIYYRQISLVSERPKEESGDPTRGRSLLTADSGRDYHLKEQKDALAQVQKNMDVFAAMHWRTKRSKETGTDILAGPMESWLLDADGTWTSQQHNLPGAITMTELSEALESDPKKSVVVGLVFKLGEAVHGIRVDQDDLLTPKNDKTESDVAGTTEKKGESDAK